MNLGSWPTQAYGGSTVRLLQDPQFFQEMQKKIDLKKQPQEYVVGLAIRVRSKGEPTWVNIEDDGSQLHRAAEKGK